MVDLYKEIQHLQEVREKIGNNIPCQFLQVFYKVATESGTVTSAELAKEFKTTTISIARAVARLSQHYNKRTEKEEGLGLIETITDDLDKRRKYLRLTPKGEQLIVELKKL